MMFYLREGLERNQGKTSPGDNLQTQKIDGSPNRPDPSGGVRHKTTVQCNGYVDPETGRRLVAAGHKAREIVFTQDAHQTSRCDACQKEYRNKYKTARKKRRAHNAGGIMAGGSSSGRPF